MTKLNKKSIFLGLQMLAILAFGVITIPAQSYAIFCSEAGCNTFYNTYSNQIVPKEDNPKPIISLISPNSSNIGVGRKTVTIIGEGFVPSSIAKVNGVNRSTTFIDSSHLLMQITGDDTYTYLSNGGFFISVFNGAPGGGYSNAVFFAVSDAGASDTGDNDTGSNFSDINGNNDYSNLASNAIFGSRGIWPSGLIGWIFFAILVLVIVILVRRAFGATEKYNAKPMKHD